MFYSYQDLRQLAVTSSKLTMKLSKNYVKFAQLSTNGLVFSFALNFLLLTFRKWQNFFWYFSCWLWTNKCRLGKIVLSLFLLVMLLYQLIKMLIDTLLGTNPSSFTMSVFERRLNLRMLYFAKKRSHKLS